MPTPTRTAPTKRRVKAPPATRKTSLYRLRSSGLPATVGLRSLVMPNYLQRDGFTSRAVDHEGISGFLVSGTIAPGDADWCTPLGGLVGMTVAEQNRTSLALLLVRTDKAVYGLTFGLGHLMIDQARIDPGFGIEFAESFSVALAGQLRQVGELDIDDLVGAVADKPEGQRLRALRQGRIQMFADTEGADRISRNVPVDHWLTAEVPDGAVHYFYGGRGEVLREAPHRPPRRPVLQVADGRLLRDAEGWGTADFEVIVRFRQGLPLTCGDRSTGNGCKPGDRLYLSNVLDRSGCVPGEDGVAVHSPASNKVAVREAPAEARVREHGRLGTTTDPARRAEQC